MEPVFKSSLEILLLTSFPVCRIRGGNERRRGEDKEEEDEDEDEDEEGAGQSSRSLPQVCVYSVTQAIRWGCQG